MDLIIEANAAHRAKGCRVGCEGMLDINGLWYLYFLEFGKQDKLCYNLRFPLTIPVCIFLFLELVIKFIDHSFVSVLSFHALGDSGEIIRCK